MKLFADTSGWGALFNRRDKYHARAATAYAALKGKQVKFITTDYVMDETLTYLMLKVSKDAAVRFGSWAVASEVVEIRPITTETWQQSWQLFKQYEDKNWAFTDCTSFVEMRSVGLEHAFTFDLHFVQAGFTLWPDQN